MDSLTSYEDLPVDAQRTVQGIRGVEDKMSAIQKEYLFARFELERKWSAKFQDAYARRLALLSGQAEATSDEVSRGEKRSRRLDPDYKKLPASKASKGKAAIVKKFWLEVLSNSDVGPHILESDVHALEHLTNIAITYPQGNTPVFTLEFAFSDNKYFKNSTIMVTYHYSVEVLPSGELRYSHVVADKIHWKPKQNLIEKAAQADVGDEDEEEGEMSFFSMLQPPASITVPPRPGKHDDDEDDERESDLELTFEFGLTVKELLLNAVDYFMGDVISDDDDEDEDDDDDWEGYSDDDD